METLGEGRYLFEFEVRASPPSPGSATHCPRRTAPCRMSEPWSVGLPFHSSSAVESNRALPPHRSQEDGLARSLCRHLKMQSQDCWVCSEVQPYVSEPRVHNHLRRVAWTTDGRLRGTWLRKVGVLGNLVPDSAQEARALVPSLNDERNLTDEEIEAILFQLNSFKSMQG